MMLYTVETAPPFWQDPLLEPAEPVRRQHRNQIPFSTHTTPMHYYEEQENN